MRERDRFILGTFELKKVLKIDIFVSLCDNSAHKRGRKAAFIMYYLGEGGKMIFWGIQKFSGRNWGDWKFSIDL